MPISPCRGHAHVDPKKPRARAICNRCGQTYFAPGRGSNSLDMQYEFQGVSVQKTGFWVCPTCLDEPNPQLAAINPPPDPIPIPFAQPPSPNTEGYTMPVED